MRYYYESNRISRYFDIHPNEPNQVEKKIISLFSSIERYLNLASIQMERLQEGEKDMEYASENFRPQCFQRAKPFLLYFSDMEFYINSVNKYFSLIKKLSDIKECENIKEILAPYKKMITTYRLTRNSFEHIDERIINQDSFIREISSIGDDILETKHGIVRLTLESLLPLYDIFDKIIVFLYLMIEERKESIDRIWYEFDQRTKKLWDEKYGPLDC